MGANPRNPASSGTALKGPNGQTIQVGSTPSGSVSLSQRDPLLDTAATDGYSRRSPPACGPDRSAREQARCALKPRYASYDTALSAELEQGKTDFKQLEAYSLKQGEAAPNPSGRQEYLENLINEFI